MGLRESNKKRFVLLYYLEFETGDKERRSLYSSACYIMAKEVDSVSVFDVLNSGHYLQFLPFSESMFFCELMVWFTPILLLSDPLCLSCSVPVDLIMNVDHILV